MLVLTWPTSILQGECNFGNPNKMCYDVPNHQRELAEQEGLAAQGKSHHASLIPIGFGAECVPRPGAIAV